MSGIVGVVLAGGLARRMGGGDKPMTEIAGRPMLDHVVERLGAQVDAMVLNANGDPQRFAAWNLPVVADSIEGFAGPLAGVLAGLEWAAVHRPEARAVVSVAGDTPFFPTDLVKRFDAATNHDITAIALAASKGYAHPVFGLWPVECADDLRAFLEAGERRERFWRS
ncbi:MAG: molybdenum cofactor guanylyltransferase MobA [Pseudomonadota bacterium]